jgi:catechol 2,3-dioxygenase-like lactoylglutathione lyase family enzyme
MLPLLLGSFLGVLDPFVVTVALPVIRDGLDASPAQTQWLFTGYSAMYGMGLISGSRLGDRYGRRRLFLVGNGRVCRGLGSRRHRARDHRPDRGATAAGVGRGSDAAVCRPGARGEGTSVYFRDPDGSLLEFICYG